MDPLLVTRVLSEIAETASETLELQDVFERVASSVGTLIPFDDMGVVRIVGGDRAVVHATTAPAEGCIVTRTQSVPLTSWSPRFRPCPEPIPRVDDAQQELDPAFPVDAEILEEGVRSSLWQPFRSRDSFTGGVWLCAGRTNAFTEQHQQVLVPISALLGSALEHWRIWDGERRRRERLGRLDRLETLLRTLAESLDVRDLFQQISDGVRPVLPHDVLVLTELDETDRTLLVTAFAGEPGATPPQGAVKLTEQESQNRLLDFEIVRNAAVEIPPDTERNRVLLSTGMSSWLRVPLRLWGEVRGSVGFLHREPSRFSPEDVAVARRLADHIALTLSHQRLAEEARIASEERERAERLEAVVARLAGELESRQRRRVVGTSASWKMVLRQVGQVATVDTTVLVTGESGTGKEVVSQLIHQGSLRATKPLVAINCAALPDQLLESELFGHEKGAFTGASTTKVGRLEQANGGTLFLDEIGEMSPVVQAKLLRVLEEREFQRLGGTRTLKVDVRLVAATNRDLVSAIAGGEFREDLYYRLNVFEISVPALRERPEDVLLLADAFLEELSQVMGRRTAGISRDARDWLLSYSWPGNVRELRNAIERAILLCDGGLITRDHLPRVVERPEQENHRSRQPLLDSSSQLPPGGVDLEDVERAYVQRALQQTAGNKAKASRLLGLTRAQLYSRIEKYGLR